MIDRDSIPAAPSPGWFDRPGRGLWPVVLLVVVALAGWRAHTAVANGPVRVLTPNGGPSAVLVVQGADCPDRRAALEEWLGGVVNGDSAGGRPPLLRLDLDGSAPASNTLLGDLPALPPHQRGTTTRALLRAGVQATPALLVLDSRGYSVFAGGFEVDGPPPRLSEALRLFDALADPSSPPSLPLPGDVR